MYSLEAAVEATNGAGVVVWVNACLKPGNMGGLTDVEDGVAPFE